MNKPTAIELVNRNLGRRRRAEKRFKLYGICSIAFGLLCLVVLFTDIVRNGVGAFTAHYLKIEVTFDPERMALQDINDPMQVALADYDAIIRAALLQRFPEVTERKQRRELFHLVSSGAGFGLQRMLEQEPRLLGKSREVWVIADDDVDLYAKYFRRAPGSRLSEQEINWVEQLLADGSLQKRFNRQFFTSGDSREPEIAGIKGALMGSLYTLLVTLLLSFPIGVAAAIYLEEYAPKNRWTDFIEVNINNLAAVPSIIFGLLGLAIFINLFALPRSIPLVGGLVLTLMTLPTIIISSRAAIKAVPPSIREAALGLGASKMQVVLHHVLPLALPGMLTGTIIGMAQALGETAPLLMIGMVAFIVDLPANAMDPATVLPVQIFLWADSPERAFTERTSAAIMVLLAFLIVMNTLAVLLRRRLERRW
ncbi:phosphate ABC transporter permease PstA [Halioxenophilus sp. WMMB6]|uniref:phosphate ABC transporter permease PstA n=1 Tax=Halioxenophilus sp. WMMB6 TaxID=3073815 RepID=UPI00295F288D|nr:phosphate ABC transporter permease PstA [Halioxenophilus sp. WMMB6]